MAVIKVATMLSRRDRKRALSMSLHQVACVALDDNGELVCQNIGGNTVNFGEDPVFVYQKGLLPPEETTRCYKSLLSNFKITTPSGSVNVPWCHFSWMPDHESRILGGDGDELDDTETSIFQLISVQNVMVVWIHGPSGERTFEWYVAFRENKDGKAFILTRVPHQYFDTIIKNSGISSYCNCGTCNHPIRRMKNTCATQSASVFENRAVKYFTEYSKRVYDYRRLYKKAKPAVVPITSPLTQFEDGTCAICLEDTKVSSSACVKGSCKLQICADCHVKTRGLCAVCDREKNNAPFLCMACDSLCHVDEFGYECFRCKKQSLCVSCYKNFGMCVNCVCDIASSKRCVKDKQ